MENGHLDGVEDDQGATDDEDHDQPEDDLVGEVGELEEIAGDGTDDGGIFVVRNTGNSSEKRSELVLGDVVGDILVVLGVCGSDVEAGWERIAKGIFFESEREVGMSGFDFEESVVF